MDERRRLSFGGVADLYDEARPSYPSALVDDVVEYAGAAGATADRVLEVGAGTGKATALFADRGLDVLAIEPSAAMARIARRNCAAYEQRDDRGDRVRTVAAAGARVQARVLGPGVALDLTRGEVRRRSGGARGRRGAGGVLEPARLDRLRSARRARRGVRAGRPRRRHGRPDEPGGALRGRCLVNRDRGRVRIRRAEVRRYQWHSNYTTAEYVALLGTHSACLILDPPEREGLLSDIAAAIDARGGRFRMTYVTLLGLARAS